VRYARPVEAAPAPTITSISPALGPSVGGTAITIIGTGFVAGATVDIGGAPATGVVVGGSTTIIATTPAGTPGAALVTVTNADTQATTLSGAFTYQYPAPTFASMLPVTGSSAGGTLVTLTGTGFRSGATVAFGATPSTGVAVVNSSTIVATSPAHQIGLTNVTVTNTDAQAATLTNGYTYTAAGAPAVTSIAPTSGSMGGGTVVTITGSNFIAGATVSFGGTTAAGVSVITANWITATAPARNSTGLVNIVVTNPDTQAGALNSAFTYTPLAAPTVLGVSPTSGGSLGGTPVTVTGTGFVTGATVSIGGVAAASVVVTSATSISAVTPPHASGAAAVTVVNTDAQSGTLASAYTFSANPVPTASAVAPATGSITGGATVTITGSGFLAGVTVTFGGVGAPSVTVESASLLTVVTPAHAAGPVAVVVRNYDTLAATMATGFTYQAVDAPTVEALAPNIGSIAGGLTTTITGTGFKTGLTVAFDLVPATSATWVNSTTILVVVPAGFPGAATVVVTNSDGQAAALIGGFTYQGPPPTLTAVTPDNGTTAGGTAVTITGTGFLAGAKVMFGTVAATEVKVVSPTELSAVTPASAAAAPLSGATAGAAASTAVNAVTITVTNPNGAPGSLVAAYTYNVVAAAGTAGGATVVAVAPPEGGLVLAVSGTNDLQALIKAQKFTVSAVFLLDVPKQTWKIYVVGAPTMVNTLTAIKATDVVVLRR
jgi:hypothetical protein